MANDTLYTFYKTWGNNILFRYRKDGVSHTKKVDFYQPSLYSKVQQGQTSEHDIKSIFGHNLMRKQFDSIRAAKQHVEAYKNVDGFSIEGNSNYANQFIIELYDGKMPEFDPKNIRMGILDIEVDAPEFPEPVEAKWPINGITIHDNFTDTYYTIGDKEYIHDAQDKDVGHLKVEYLQVSNELELLRAMLRHFREFQYDATSGWNSELFDMPYIVNRCFKIIGEEITKSSLSPFNMIELREVNGNFGKAAIKADIMGLPHLDYMQLYSKHIFTPRESMKLGFIGEAELGMTKLSYEEEGSLQGLYALNPQKFYKYNIRDVAIVKGLDDKLGLFNITYTLAYYCLSNYEDTLGTTKIWEQLIAKFLYTQGMAPIFSAKRMDGREFDGAFVHPTQIGRHLWALSIDLNSLYPMNEIQYNIGPNTWIPPERLPDELLALRGKYELDDLVHKRVDLSVLKKYDVIMAGNFEFYDRSYVGFMASIKDELYTGRKKFKKKMLAAQSETQRLKAEANKEGGPLAELTRLIAASELADGLNNNLQMAMKILLNAGYGAVGNKHFLYYKVENAEAITLSGQLINKWTHVRVNALLNHLLGTTDKNRTIAGDTDSLYLVLDDVVEKLGIRHLTDNEITDRLDQFMKTVLAPKIDGFAEELCEYMNGMQNKMVWEREIISPVSIFVRKKGYTALITDSEGVRFTDKKFKVVGLEAIKARSYPAWSRAYLKECYRIALDGTKEKLHARVAEIKQEFMALPLNTIALPTGVNGLEKYYDAEIGYIKGTPKHVKAALNHNKLIKDMGLTAINQISSGNRIKYVPLKRPNTINQDVIGFEFYLPSEFQLDKFVDRDTIFETAFMNPLLIFLEAIKWTPEPVISLEDFFS